MDEDSFESRAASPQKDSESTKSQRGGRFEPDAKLLKRIAAGESSRSLARELGIAHTTISRSLQVPKVASRLRAAKRVQRAQHAKERRAERALPRRAREQTAQERELKRRDELNGQSSADRMSRNDKLAAEAVAAGGGVQELIEQTGLRTRLNVYESIDPQIVLRARANDRSRPRGQLSVETFRRLRSDPLLIPRRAKGESLRRLAADHNVSRWTMSRFFACPEVAKELRLHQRELERERRNGSGTEDQSHDLNVATLAVHYASKIPDVWCPVHARRTYVRSVETSESQARLEVAGCCEEAIKELLRWLEIYRPLLPTVS